MKVSISSFYFGILYFWEKIVIYMTTNFTGGAKGELKPGMLSYAFMEFVLVVIVRQVGDL